jgi:hypothetical protein
MNGPTLLDGSTPPSLPLRKTSGVPQMSRVLHGDPMGNEDLQLPQQRSMGRVLGDVSRRFTMIRPTWQVLFGVHQLEKTSIEVLRMSLVYNCAYVEESKRDRCRIWPQFAPHQSSSAHFHSPVHLLRYPISCCGQCGCLNPLLSVSQIISLYSVHSGLERVRSI